MSTKDKTNKDDRVYYSNIKTEGLKQSIIFNANQMISLGGKIDTINLIDKVIIDNNPIITYKDDKGNRLNADKDNDYWLKEVDNYITYLQDTLDADLSNIDAEQLKQLSIDFNKMLITKYIGGIKTNIIDLIDSKENYANHLATALVDLQALEIVKIGIKEFNKLNLQEHNKDFRIYMQLDDLIDIQKTTKIINAKDLEKVDIPIIKQLLYEKQILQSINQVEQIIKDNKKYYDDLHKKYNKINDLIKKIGNKYKKRDADLSNISKNELFITETNKNNDVVVKRSNLKLPSTYNIDFDIMKLFNNIYPNYRYKAIDDNRHKDLDIQAKLMLDLDTNTSDETQNLQNMRLINFIKSGNIALYPIQSALINGFISIRDNQDTIDKVVPLLTTLKYITENKNLRLPKSKKDLELYEDFMLFFDRCKMQVKIVDRKTKNIIFEIMQPIPILSNTPAYNGISYGYVIGNSVLNLLKNELDKIYTTPHQTSIKTNKGYLSSKLPTTPPTINLTQYIYSKIAQMINSYQRIGKYNGKVNITPLYDFQALYQKRYKPNKDDKDKVREMLNKYLDSLINKGLIKSYTAIKTGKEINQYKIEINKDAKL